MTTRGSSNIVIIGGPSCVGKSPLAKALKRFYPKLTKPLKNIVLHNSRAPRPGEEDGVDYHFRSREQIEKLRDDDRYVVLDVRGDLQALDLRELEKLGRKGDPFFEGNPAVARTLQTHEKLKEFKRVSIFVSPLSQAEIVELKGERNVDLPALVTDLMRRKLLRRTQKQKTILSAPDLENVERRANNAFRELKEARHFQYVVPNHDGEDSDNWEAFHYPLGDARRTLQAVAAILGGEDPPAWVESWEEDLLGEIDEE